MEDKIKTVNSKFTCPECKNEVVCNPDLNVDDVTECTYCGMEYEVIEKNGSEFQLQPIEEEK